jgi:zinc protease
VYQKQLALTASSSCLALEDSGLLFVWCFAKADVAPAVVEAEVDAEIERLQTELVAPDELERVKTRLIAAGLAARESLHDKAHEIGHASVVAKDPRSIDSWLERYRTVTAGDVQRVARAYLSRRNRTVVYIVPAAPQPPRGAPDEKP